MPKTETKQQKTDETVRKLDVSGVSTTSGVYESQNTVSGFEAFGTNVFYIPTDSTLLSDKIASQINSFLTLSSYFPS